jgi:hypothetical protein
MRKEKRKIDGIILSFVFGDIVFLYRIVSDGWLSVCLSV